MRPRHLGAVCALVDALSVVRGESTAEAYPRAVVFAPTGTTYDQGEIAAFAVVVRDLDPTGQWQTWAGAQLGLWSGIAADAGTFLAVEAGADLAFRPGGAPSLVPLFNTKIALVDERAHRPAVALGLYQLSPIAASSANLLYVSSTKSWSVARTSLGELTLGALASLAASARTTDCSDRCAFRGSFPVADNRYGFLVGWSSPPLGPARFALDVTTGTSLASGANAVVSFDVADHFHPFVGVSLAVDRRVALQPSDAAFVGLAFGAAPDSHGRAERSVPRAGSAR